MERASAAEEALEHNAGEPPGTLSLQQAQYLSDIDVALQIEVGAISITAEQLIDLAPGQSLPFECDMEQELVLRFAGEEVARGRFCSEDGKIFIEIVAVHTDEGTAEC